MAKINLEVIDQMFSAVLSANESKERIDALRPQVEEAVIEEPAATTEAEPEAAEPASEPAEEPAAEPTDESAEPSDSEENTEAPAEENTIQEQE